MKIVRSITHWTGGGNRANEKDKEHYHTITEGDGKIVYGKEKIEDNVVTSDGDYAAHTLNLNTGSFGPAMAGMHGATEHPFRAGPSPITETQFEAHCRMLAEFHTSRAIPITPETCLTHAEVEHTLGVKQRAKWDLTRLPHRPELIGAKAVGDYMRARVKFYAGLDDRGSLLDDVASMPTLRRGSKGTFVRDLQKQLTMLKYHVGDIDGAFGPATERAVRSLQGDEGLIADGIVGAQTWAALGRSQGLVKRDVSIDDLRDRGSTTIKSSDDGKVAMTGGAAVLAIDAVSKVQEVGDALANAENTIGSIQALVITYWPTLALLGVGFLAWKYFGKISLSRVRDAQDNSNMGR